MLMNLVNCRLDENLEYVVYDLSYQKFKTQVNVMWRIEGMP
jgi:hypothetical protein